MLRIGQLLENNPIRRSRNIRHGNLGVEIRQGFYVD